MVRGSVVRGGGGGEGTSMGRRRRNDGEAHVVLVVAERRRAMGKGSNGSEGRRTVTAAEPYDRKGAVLWMDSSSA